MTFSPTAAPTPVRVQGVDVDGDVAVVAVETAGRAAVEWAAGDPAVGTPVFAVAYPGGRGAGHARAGLVVGQAFRGPWGRRITGSVEHTAPDDRVRRGRRSSTATAAWSA